MMRTHLKSIQHHLAKPVIGHVADAVNTVVLISGNSHSSMYSMAVHHILDHGKWVPDLFQVRNADHN